MIRFDFHPACALTDEQWRRLQDIGDDAITRGADMQSVELLFARAIRMHPDLVELLRRRTVRVSFDEGENPAMWSEQTGRRPARAFDNVEVIP